MKAAGVIVEFNPLHDGHIEHLRETTRITGREHIIAVMSGNFVQRGEPAIVDKWQRTRMALHAGVDIVIELPVAYVISGAEDFAQGAVRLLAATGIVDRLCFGSECGDIKPIIEAGRILAYETNEYKKNLAQGLSCGLSFAAARSTALAQAIETNLDGLLTKPNNGLGIEYCKALWQLGWPMEASTSYRRAGGPSATAIRKTMLVSSDKSEFAHLNNFSQIFRYMIFTTNPDLGEGLENRFRHYAREHSQLTDILDAVKTKRYTYTRLQRAALGVILGITKPNKDKTPPYIRVLGFKREKANLLGELARNANLPVITHNKSAAQLDTRGKSMLEKEHEASDIYNLAQGNNKNERNLPLVII